MKKFPKLCEELFKAHAFYDTFLDGFQLLEDIGVSHDGLHDDTETIFDDPLR